MFEDLKKKSFKKSLPATVIVFIIAVVLAVIAIPKLTNVKDFEDLDPDEIKNQNVKIGVTANLGCFLEEYSENTRTHKRTTTHLYYVIYTGDENETDYKYMSIKVPKKYQKKMEDIMELTEQMEFSDPLYFVGHIRKLDSEEYRYFKSAWKSIGSDEEWIEENTLPYYVDVTGTSIFTGGDVIYVILLVGAGLLVLWGILRIVKASNGSYIKPFTKDIESAGYTEASAFSDLNNAFSFSGNDVKVGRLLLFYSMNDTVPRAIPVGKILWAYQNTTTHRTNGIKTGTTYSVMIYVNDSKTATNIPVASEAAAQGILQQMNTMYPWVVIGYSDEIKKMFNKNRAQFLQLRYNTVEHTAVEPGFENRNVTVSNAESSTNAESVTNAESNTDTNAEDKTEDQ